ncbi:MAG: SDR family NAD(P)-dependent oxidoreductase [Lachnospiraceae bacterium]|nr:SDR family NAD(P)-dependent oxidoreductase [Lachnospiraceae bacterium]
MANIVIVGANQGIGDHMAKRLLELNHSVVVLDIDISNIRQLQQRYPETLLPYMRKQKDGRMIFTSSGVGVTGFENISPYAATKRIRFHV